MSIVTITKPSDLLQFVDSIKHDFFDEGMETGLKTRIEFFIQGGPESHVVTMLNKPVEDHVRHMNANLNLALDAAINEIRKQGGLVFGETQIVLSEELLEQDE